MIFYETKIKNLSIKQKKNKKYTLVQYKPLKINNKNWILTFKFKS